MIFIKCPYCNEDINILFGEEMNNLIKNGISDCKCDYCLQTFQIFLGKEKIETREINDQ